MEITGKIKLVSTIRKFQGNHQIGFVLEEKPKKWYNVQADREEPLKELQKTILQKGNEISFDYFEATDEVSDIHLEKQAPKPKQSQNQSNNQDEMTCFEDLLADAHKKFGKDFNIFTELLRDETGKAILNLEKKFAVFKATVVIGEGNKKRFFEAHGDSTSENVGSMVKEHFIRMAETRAIVRALRFATNNAQVAQEEVGDTPTPQNK